MMNQDRRPERIWFTEATPEQINQLAPGTMVERIGIEFTEVGDDFLKARMPVDDRTVQPARLLHGGASVVLAETLGSVAANLCIDPARKTAVGLEINANHVRAVRDGVVAGTARALHLGATTHIWQIMISDARERLVCVARLTMAILDRREPPATAEDDQTGDRGRRCQGRPKPSGHEG
jgi:1,4-dihydroxy-2-naphthoyl-CoA hydrolase